MQSKTYFHPRASILPPAGGTSNTAHMREAQHSFLIDVVDVDAHVSHDLYGNNLDALKASSG